MYMAQCRLVWLVKLAQKAETTSSFKTPRTPAHTPDPKAKAAISPPSKAKRTDGHQKGLAWDPDSPPIPNSPSLGGN